MQPVLIAALRSLHPLEIISAEEIAKRFFSGPGNSRAYFRNQIKCGLKHLPQSFPPLGDQPDIRTPAAYFGFRWIASTVKRTPPRPPASYPMDSLSMAMLFPDLRPKLLRLPLVVVHPHHFHEFLAAIHAWTPAQPKPSLRFKKRFDNSPIFKGYVGVSQ